jgi:putative Holliday junction resolvase
LSPELPPRQTLLGFDFGRLRIGVAVGNTVTGTARALTIVDTEPLERRWAAIASLVDEWRPDALVVGRPAWHEGNGASGAEAVEGGKAADDSNVRETAARCERFARQLAGRFRLPVELVDESGSSLEAAAALAAGRRRGPDDAEAAAIILRQYLSHR